MATNVQCTILCFINILHPNNCVSIYTQLVTVNGVCAGDSSSANGLNEKEVDERVKLFFEMEDPEIIIDLRELNTGQHTKYDIFWEECQKFLQEDIGLAVDERRHTNITHMARAISARDLLEQVSSRCHISIVYNCGPRVHICTQRFNVKYIVQLQIS